MTDPSPPNLKEVLQELELRFGSEGSLLVPAREHEDLKAVSERRSPDGDGHRGLEGSPQHFSVSGGDALATNTTPGGDTDHPPLSGSEPDASLPIVPAPPEPQDGKWQRLYNIVAHLGPRHGTNDIVDEAHDLIRELRAAAARSPETPE